MTQKNRLFRDGLQHSERFFEVTKTPQTIVERFPLHAGNCVLHQSKILLVDFVVVLEKFLQEESFKFLYTGKSSNVNLKKGIIIFIDTDSFALSFTDGIDNLVRPELVNEWEKVKKKLFVLDETDAFDLRFPGKWKKEFSTTHGAIIM